MGSNVQFSASPSGRSNIASGLGGGPNLLATNLASTAYGMPISSRTLSNPAQSTADYYGTQGLLYDAPYDLNTMGSWGAARISALGFRYFWVIGPNHNSTYGWGLDSETIYIAFTNDPAILPSPDTMKPIVSTLGTKQTGTAASFTASSSGSTMTVSAISSGIIALGYNVVGLGSATTVSAMGTGRGGTGTYSISSPSTTSSTACTCTLPGTQLFNGHFFPWFVYNPDEPSAPGFLYLQCIVTFGANVNSWNTGLWTTNDLLAFSFQGISHTNSANPGFGFASAQTIYRNSTGNWISYGSDDTTGATKGYWTSTDGRRFTFGATTTTNVGSSVFPVKGTRRFTVGAQTYIVTWEDARGGFWSSGTTYGGGDRAFVSTYSGVHYPNAPSGPRDQHYYEFQTYVSTVVGNLNNPPATSPLQWSTVADGEQFVTQVAVDSNGNILSSPSPVRLSNPYTGTFPGPTYVTDVNGIYEDGILYIYALHGFSPGLNPSTLAQPYTAGGGLQQEYLDLYAVVLDSVAAASAAPSGVSAYSDSGNVYLSWYDIIPGHTYRIYRGASAGSITTLVANVSNVGSYTDTGATAGAVNYYKVVTVNAGTEAGFRTVSTYASSRVQLVNMHITRALAAGATAISESHLANLVSWLAANNKTPSLCLATAAWMGVIKNVSNVISRIFDLGTTIMPRRGDFTPWDTVAGGSSTNYSATAVGGVSPGWINTAATSFGMYGNYGNGQGFQGRTNPIRQESQITCVAVYQKSGSTKFTALGINEFSGQFVLQETAGTPGTAQWVFADSSSTSKTATATLSGSGLHVIAGVYDGTNVICYADGVAGTPQAASSNFAIYQQFGSSSINYMLGTGSTGSKCVMPNDSSVGGTYSWSNNEAKGTMHSIFIFNVALTAAEILSFTNLLTTDAATP